VDSAIQAVCSLGWRCEEVKGAVVSLALGLPRPVLLALVSGQRCLTKQQQRGNWIYLARMHGAACPPSQISDVTGFLAASGSLADLVPGISSSDESETEAPRGAPACVSARPSLPFPPSFACDEPAGRESAEPGSPGTSEAAYTYSSSMLEGSVRSQVLDASREALLHSIATTAVRGVVYADSSPPSGSDGIQGPVPPPELGAGILAWNASVQAVGDRRAPDESRWCPVCGAFAPLPRAGPSQYVVPVSQCNFCGCRSAGSPGSSSGN
jgi:hypothetical protein